VKRALRAALRAVFVIHRYLGIGLGVLMAVWCLSGVVMMYVSYPDFSDAERRAGLPVIDTRAISIPADALPDDAGVRQFSVEMQGTRPVLRVGRGFGFSPAIDLRTGKAVEPVGTAEATAVAHVYGERAGLGAPTLKGLVDVDQWTVYRLGDDRPLYKFAYPDKAATELYVSQPNGRPVQLTTGAERFWGWFGAVPHWLYFTQLRQDGQLWSQVVIWTSLVGCFLTLTGLYLGIVQLRRRRSTGKLSSPYRGFLWWHHVPGLVFGVVTLTWVFSGLMSMEPFGWLAGSDNPIDARARLVGEAPKWSQVRQALPAMLGHLPPGTVSVQSAPTAGKLYAVATRMDGERVRIDAAGAPAPMGEADYARVARALSLGGGPARWSLQTQADAYYYGSVHDRPLLPVLRVTAPGKDPTVFYVDPVSGRMVDYHDRDGRMRRWLHNGLHSLDFAPVLRMRPVWDLIVLPLLLGAALVCATGAWLGIKRLARRPVRRVAEEIEPVSETAA
jgi:uncharacterized iron-regulated membrane protein